ncbi:MAG: acyl carrier protein [Candidatus Omnitrophica bacterium]|nr:acyl carrier protein [Candidatus Omnitrophota bacterium]
MDIKIIKDRLNKVFQNVFNDDTIQVQESTTAQDIEQWDSLMHITLIVAVEKEFKIRLNTSEVGKLQNVGALIKILEERVKD